MKAVIIIPARKGSTRFPNKPLALLHGKTVLYRTWLIAKSVQAVDEVYIATDDNEILVKSEKFGAKVLLTSGEFQNGTERVYSATKQLKSRPDIIINLQGDAVLTPPWVIQEVLDSMLNDPSIKIATPATHLNQRQFAEFQKSKSSGRVSGTLVVFDQKDNALYFSKGIIPFNRDSTQSNLPIYRHIGLYGYRFSTIEEYVRLAPTPLEQVEKLEQLRAVENGIPIKIIKVDYRGRTHWSIDNPEDLSIAEQIILREGELV